MSRLVSLCVVRLFLSTLGLRQAALWGLGCGHLIGFGGPLPLRAVSDGWSLRFYRLLSLISGAVVF